MNEHLNVFLAKGAVFRPPLKHAWTTKRSAANPVPFKLILPIANLLSAPVSGRNGIAKTAFHAGEGSHCVLHKFRG